MKKSASMTQQKCARWILIFSVLAGLFFSNGEGIQLLPFPIAKVCDSKNTSFVLEKNLKSYAFSVHNSGNYSPLLESKFQKHANQHSASGHLSFDCWSICAKLFLQPARHREEANLSLTSVFLTSQSDRAPPTV